MVICVSIAKGEISLVGWVTISGFPFRVDIKQHSHQSLSPVLDVLSGS